MSDVVTPAVSIVELEKRVYALEIRLAALENRPIGGGYVRPPKDAIPDIEAKMRQKMKARLGAMTFTRDQLTPKSSSILDIIRAKWRKWFGKCG